MRKLAFALAASLLAGVGTFAPAAAPQAFAATNPKVAIIVGATHERTASYRADADQVYAEAIKYTTNVVKVYSPNATWSRVQAAVSGASVIVYLGHGNGWPSPYTYDPAYATKDGFGLNYDLNGDGKLSDYENKYYGEPSIRTLKPAPNAVVLLFHLCYASGNSEPGQAEPTLSTAKQRVDNFGSAFLKAGARAVIANGHSHDPYYIRALFATKQSIEDYWRNAPDYHGNELAYPSTRSPGYSFLMDPDSPTPSSFYRSIVGKMSLTTEQVTGASYASTAGDPSTFAVPGNASPAADGAPVYGSVETAAAATDPTATLATGDKVRIDGRELTAAGDGSPIFRIHTDSGVEGWMTGSSLVPRDSRGPNLWTVEDGTGAFSPNGDGSQDAQTVALELSEPAAWTLRIRDNGGATLATASGNSDTPAITWAPAAGSVADGTYAWSIDATDSWDNSPLNDGGPIAVDTLAPSMSVSDAEAAAAPVFTPNGDGVTDTIGFGVGANEPATILGTAVGAGDTTVASFETTVGTSGGTLRWDGRAAGGAYAADGTYAIRIAARDRAGNVSDAAVRTVDLYGSLGWVARSASLVFPQDGDKLASTVTFSFVLKSAATVTWVVTSDAGVTVRTIKTAEPLAAGTYTYVWNGRNDAGAYVARGSFYSRVAASNGAQAVTQAISTRLDAFRVTSSDSTPARRQRITVYVYSAEPLRAAPRVRVYQPGIASWSTATTRVSTRTYRVTLTLRSSHTGSLRLLAYGYDSNGASQSTSIYLPLH